MMDPSVPKEPEEAADQIVTLTKESVRSVILACYIVSSFLEGQPTPKELKRFIDRLVERRFLSHRDGNAHMREHGKLSMLKNIGKLKDVYFDERIFPYLVPDYSTLYQIGRRYKLVDFDVDRLRDSLADLPVDYTREDLIKSNALVKASKAADQVRSGEMRRALGVSVDAGDGDNTIAAADLPVDLLVSEPAPSDLKNLRKDYAEADALDRLLARPRVAENASVVVIVRVGELGLVERTLLPHLGFDEIKHVMLLGDTSSNDIISSRVAVVAVRGSRECSTRALGLGRPGTPAHAIAEMLFPGSQSKAAIFTQPASGWIGYDWNGEAQ